MMWLGVILHVAVNHIQGYFPLPWRDPETTPVANFIFYFIHAFRMPVFFVVAGFFAALLAAQRGWFGMAKHRLMRLGLPFIVFWPPLFMLTGLLIMRYMSLMMDAGTGLPPGMGVAAESTEGMERSPISTLHLWFIYYLIWFCLTAAAFGWLGRWVPAAWRTGAGAILQRIVSSWWGVIILTAPLAFIGSFFARGVVRTTGSFIPTSFEFFHYGLFFAIGWVIYRYRDELLDRYVRACWRYAAAGLVSYVIARVLFYSVDAYPEQTQLFSTAIAIAYNLTSLLWSFALLGLFMRYLPQRNRVLAYIADSAYWVYLIHMLCTIGFGVLLYNAPLGAFAKMAINILATTLVCLVSYHVLVRYTFVSTFLNGRRHEYKGFFTRGRIGVAVALLFACYLGITQIKFAETSAPARGGPPAAITVPADVAAFLAELGKAYGSANSAEVGRYLASDFLHQGMDKGTFLDHLQKHQRYLGKLEITPVALKANGDELQLTAYAKTPHGVLGPPLQLLPLHVGATLIKEEGAWKLRGNQQMNETGLYKELNSVYADFSPSDLDAYKRMIPAGFSMPQTPWVRVLVVHWKDVEPPQTPYRLAQLSILVNKDGADIWHILAMPETDWLVVEAGKQVGFPKMLADVDIKRSFSNEWRVEVRRDGKPLADIAYDPIVITKTTDVSLPVNPDAWLVLTKDGYQQKSLMTELMPPLRQKHGLGWMTIHPQASPWKELLAQGSRAPAGFMEARGPRKLHVYALNNVSVPADIKQTFERISEAWARGDMKAVLENYHAAFLVTNQKDLAAMRRINELSRRYEWLIKDFRQEGDFAWIKGEVLTDIGAFPQSARLIKELGRWVFYGDGGSIRDRELKGAAVFDRQTKPGVFEADARKEAQEVMAAKDDLRFDTSTKELWDLATLSNAIFKPAGSGPFPALVLLHDCSGRQGPGMRNWIDVALKKSYVVMVVDSMRGHPSNCTSPLKVSIARRVKDAYDALEHLRTLPMVDPKRIAVTGFSQGGIVALLLSSKEFADMFSVQHRFAAASALYPLCYMSARYAKYDIDFLRQDTDIPLKVLMGEEDTYTPAYDCMLGLLQLNTRGAPVEWHIFPKASHGWDIPEINGRRVMSFRGDMVGFSYNQTATTESRKMLFDFLERRMGKAK